MYRDHKLNWFSTDGGPYIAIPTKHLSEWGGQDNQSQEVPSGDYKRACDINGWIGVISVGEAEGLVLETEGNAVAWYPINNDSSDGLFVVWVFADSEENILTQLNNVPEN